MEGLANDKGFALLIGGYAGRLGTVE